MTNVNRIVSAIGVFAFACLSGLPLSGQTVQLINTVRPTATDFYVGETWILNVWGGTGQTVTISATHNGVPLGTSTLGTTDGTGFFSLSGSMSTAEIGSWVETVTVGGIAATPTLAFQVLGSASDPCESVSVSLNPLFLVSFDYYVGLGTYSHSTFGSGTQSGEGEAPYCVISYFYPLVPGGVDQLAVTDYDFPSAYEAEVEWSDIGGTRFTSHPAVVGGATVYVGVDIRNGIPFVGIGATELTVFRVDLP